MTDSKFSDVYEFLFCAVILKVSNILGKSYTDDFRPTDWKGFCWRWLKLKVWFWMVGASKCIYNHVTHLAWRTKIVWVAHHSNGIDKHSVLSWKGGGAERSKEDFRMWPFCTCQEQFMAFALSTRWVCEDIRICKGQKRPEGGQAVIAKILQNFSTLLVW